MENMNIKPIGIVRSKFTDILDVPLWGREEAVIQLFPEYVPALERIEDHSHFWILCWFDKAARDKLKIRPERIDPYLPVYGVFGLRTPSRPNPIALSLVKLLKIQDNLLYVAGLDALDGTYVLDIKPYFEQDIIFSPKTPFIKPRDHEKRYNSMVKEALNHHQEDCPDLRIAVRMGLIAEERFGKLNSPDLLVDVAGSLCLADVVQGITRARLANPPRFNFTVSNGIYRTIWTKDSQQLSIELKETASIDLDGADDELFNITMQ